MYTEFFAELDGKLKQMDTIDNTMDKKLTDFENKFKLYVDHVRLSHPHTHTPELGGCSAGRSNTLSNVDELVALSCRGRRAVGWERGGGACVQQGSTASALVLLVLY